jgi:hypothetical protein
MRYEKIDPAFAAVSHFHMGALCMVEQLAATMLGHFVRFALSPRWRNISAFGMLDEIRHAQLHLLFSHDLLKHDARFDWCQKAFHTNEWGIIAIRNFCDDWLLNANCVDAAAGHAACAVQSDSATHWHALGPLPHRMLQERIQRTDLPFRLGRVEMVL